MHPFITAFSFAIICCSLTSCAPIYKESNFIEGGYKTSQLSQNEFKIDYCQGLFTDTSNISGQDHIRMLRAANVTKENGFQYFVICYSPTSHPNDKAIYIKCYDENRPCNAVNAENFLKYNQ